MFGLTMSLLSVAVWSNLIEPKIEKDILLESLHIGWSNHVVDTIVINHEPE